MNGIGVRLEAQAEIVIAPNTNRICLGQQSAGLFNPTTLFKQIANHDDLIDSLTLEMVESSSQMFDVFMDVRQQSEFHQVASCSSSSKWNL